MDSQLFLQKEHRRWIPWRSYVFSKNYSITFWKGQCGWFCSAAIYVRKMFAFYLGKYFQRNVDISRRATAKISAWTFIICVKFRMADCFVKSLKQWLPWHGSFLIAPSQAMRKRTLWLWLRKALRYAFLRTLNLLNDFFLRLAVR